MAIEFVCPSCQSGLRVDEGTVGQVVRCGSCLATVRVPEVPPEPQWEAPPARSRAEPLSAPGERPRRPLRRRPAPPVKKGRSALFWVLLVFLVLAILGAASCGGLVWMLQPKWQTHHSATGGFKVELPGPPRSDMRDLAKMNQDPDFQVEGTVLVFQGEGYGIMYREIEPAIRRAHSDERLMDEIVKGIERDHPDISVLRSSPTVVSGFPARELVLSHPVEGYSLWRVVVADTRLYLVFAGGRNAKVETNPRIRRFLDSFEITDPVLVAKANARSKQAALPTDDDDDDPDDTALEDAIREARQECFPGAGREAIRRAIAESN